MDVKECVQGGEKVYEKVKCVDEPTDLRSYCRLGQCPPNMAIPWIDKKLKRMLGVVLGCVERV